MRWGRHRRADAPLTGTALANTWQACSLLLGYPDEQLLVLLPAIRSALAQVPSPVADPLLGFVELLETSPLAQLQADYVDTFDVTRRCSLHLTYFTHGDTRRRGVALVQFKQAYRHGGVEFDDEAAGGELPDHLPVVLEFGATVDAGVAWKLLNDHRVGLELLRLGLQRRSSPWLPVVEAVRATLPALDADDHVALRRLVEQGPPNEEVGLGDLSLAPYSAAPEARMNPQPLPFPTVAEFGLEPTSPAPGSPEGAVR